MMTIVQYCLLLIVSSTMGIVVGVVLAYTIGLQEQIYMNIPSLFTISYIV